MQPATETKAPQYQLYFSENQGKFKFYQRQTRNHVTLLKHKNYILSRIEDRVSRKLKDIGWDNEKTKQLSPSEFFHIIDEDINQELKPHIQDALDNVGFSLLDVLELYCDRDELEAKIERGQFHLRVYQDRIDLYAPTFEKDSREANIGWDKMWEKGNKLMAESKNPMSMIHLIIKSYPEDMQSNPETFSQDLKNEVFKAIRVQVEKEKGNKEKGGLRKV